MKQIKSFSLRVKLTTVLIIAALVPLLVLSKLFFIGSEQALKENTLAQLSMSAEYKVGEIHLFLQALKTNAMDFASDGFIKNELIRITQYFSSEQSLNHYLIQNKLPTQSDLLAIDIVNTNGLIISSSLTSRIGMDLSKKLYYQKGLLQSYVAQFEHAPNSELRGIIATPLISNFQQENMTLGVLVNHYRMNKIQDIFSGELLLSLGAKSEHRILSVSESIYMLDFESSGIIASENSLVEKKYSFNFDTQPIQEARIKNKESKGIWQNHLGLSVLGVSIISKIDGLKFILLAEQEVDKAFLLINSLKNKFYIILLITIMIILILSFLLAYIIVNPLKKVINSLDIIASGQFDIDIEHANQYKELSDLVSKFNNMAAKLKNIKAASDHKNQQLLELSVRDHLTGLFNHRHLIEYGDIRVLEANRSGIMLSLLMIDIDHFKQINDTYGHPCGDYVISEIALLLKKTLRSIDILARYGGEEFAVIMPNTTMKNAKIVADKICKKIQAHQFFYEQQQFKITVSIGITVQKKSETKIMKVIKRADQALYQSKKNGRNQVSLCQHSNQHAYS